MLANNIIFLLIPASALLNRIRGGGLIPVPDWLPRKLVSGLVLAILTIFITYSPHTGPIILFGWYMRNILGTHYLFNAIHGWEASKSSGIWYGTMRGGLTLVTTILLAILWKNWYIVPFGLIGCLQGTTYYLCGKLPVKNTVAYAEVVDGGVYGLVLALAIMVHL